MNPRRLGALVSLLLLVAACGSSSESGSAASGDAPTATLAIISTEIETALGGAAFAAASEGQDLSVGDQVHTDRTGFAEVTYHDGSWQRVEAEATLTVVALRAAGSVNEVRTSVGVGRSWNSVAELDDPEDSYEVSTPVASAAVRGTVFATECTSVTSCTFTVVEGEVQITPVDGAPVEVSAGERLTLEADEPPGAPEEVGDDELAADAWIAKNRGLDAERAPSDEGDEGDDQSDGAALPAACDLLTTDEATAVADSNEEGYRVTRVAAGPEPVQPLSLRSGSSSRRVNGMGFCSWLFDANNEDGAYFDITVGVSVRRPGPNDAPCEPSSTFGPATPIPGIADGAAVAGGGSAAAVKIDGLCIELSRSIVDESGGFARGPYEAALQAMAERVG